MMILLLPWLPLLLLIIIVIVFSYNNDDNIAAENNSYLNNNQDFAYAIRFCFLFQLPAINIELIKNICNSA